MDDTHSGNLTVTYDTAPINVACPLCGSEPGERCWDSVDELTKLRFHAERHIKAGWRCVVQ